WANEESDELLEDGLSEASFDEEYRKNVYIDWQKLFNEELPALPLWDNLDLYGMNEEVQGVVIDANGLREPHEWYIQADEKVILKELQDKEICNHFHIHYIE